MSAGVLAMLVGLFLVPAWLLAVGHHWRKRSERLKGAFWGGVIGHTIAALVACVAALYLPEMWSDANVVRGLLGLWLMLLGGLGGMALGAALRSR
jgi:hypothetical protein